MPHKRAKFSVRMADRASKGKDLAPTTSNRLEIATMPKGAMRILQAEQVQKAYHERRRQQEEERLRAKGNGKGKGKGKEADGATVEKEELRMRPGERARDFNRRVEDAYAGEISQTIKATSSSTSKKRDNKKKRRQPDAGDDDDDDADERFRKRRATNDGKDRGPSKADLKKEREALEFEKASQRRSVNDVVQAPPTLTKAPRGEGAAAKKRKAELRALLSGGEVQQEKEKARLPEPIHKAAGGGLKRQKDLVDERDRAIKAYRSQKQRQQQQ